MRVATWCIGGVRGHQDLLREWLKRRRPAVVALQKIQAPDPVFPADALRQVDYRSESLCRRRSFGVALLVRSDLPKPDVLDRGLPGGDGQDDGFLTARVGDLVVSSVYAPYGDPKTNGFAGALELKIAWLRRLTTHVKARRMASDCSLLCGDFNVLPDVPPAKRVLNRTREEQRRLRELRATGFEDLYLHKEPWDPGFNYEFNIHEPPTSRLQLLLGSEKVVDSVVCARVDLEYRAQLAELRNQTWPSSAPVIVDLNGPPWRVTALLQGTNSRWERTSLKTLTALQELGAYLKPWMPRKRANKGDTTMGDYTLRLMTLSSALLIIRQFEPLQVTQRPEDLRINPRLSAQSGFSQKTVDCSRSLSHRLYLIERQHARAVL